MSLLFEGMNQKRFDIRLVERGLAKGSLHAPEIEKYLQSLPDETENADFDTDFHEAIAMVPGMGDDKKGKVIDCVQSGYTMNDEVIRHAKVAVGQ